MLYPLRFHPLYKRYLWGGRKFETSLARQLPPGDDFAESWEIADHGADQSLVGWGPLAGTTLGQLAAGQGGELLGRHHPQTRFPLIAKFLDAHQTLSVQVHPNDAQAAALDPPDFGKTEAWIILEADPHGVVYAGLKPGVDRPTLERAMQAGRCADCLNCFHPQVGDCIFLPAGAVHALGAGLLVAEIQQSSDTTFRLFDWNRLGTDGKPRQLHVRQGLGAVDFDLGPISPRRASDPDRRGAIRLVACDKFALDRYALNEPIEIGGDGRFHVVIVLEGSLLVEGDLAPVPMSRGSTALLPASLGPVRLTPQLPVVALDSYLPG